MMSAMQNFLQKLIEPRIPTTEPLGFRMRVVSAFLLLQVTLAILFMPFIVVYMAISRELTILLVVSAIISFVMYLVSRTLYHRYIMMMNVVFLSGLVWFVYLTLNAPEDVTPFFHIIPVFLISIFYPKLYTLLLGVVNLTILTLVYVSSQGTPTVMSAGYFLTFANFQATIVLLMMFGSWLVERQNRRSQYTEARMRSLMRANREIIIIFDTKGRVLDVNDAFERTLGYTREQVLWTRVMRLVAPQDRGILATWQEQFAKPVRLEGIHSDGHHLPFSVTIYRHEYNEKPAFVLTGQDLSTQEAFERKSYELQMRYEALFTQTQDAIYIIGLDQSLVACNERALELHGCERHELIGQHFDRWIAKEELSQAEDRMAQLLAGETPPLYQRKFYRKDGSVFHGEVNVMLVRDRNGQPMYIQSTVRDLAPRQEMEQQRLHIALQRERMSLLQEFIGDASHYFRTPLANIKTSAYLMSRLQDKPDKLRHQLTVTNAEIDRMERLLDDLLLMTRLNRLDASASATDVNIVRIQALLRSIIENQHQTSETCDYVLEINDDEDMRLLGRYSQLEQVLVNLLQNAITYCDANAKIHIHVFVHAYLIVIDIQDNGIGIPAEDLPNIFNNFYRGKHAHEYDPTASGLGLSIAQRIIQLHQGWLEVHSVYEKGTTMRVVLPHIDHTYPNLEAMQAVILPPVQRHTQQP
jgi:PAS domain S-box-containing protein